MDNEFFGAGLISGREWFMIFNLKDKTGNNKKQQNAIIWIKNYDNKTVVVLDKYDSQMLQIVWKWVKMQNEWY